MKNSRTITRCLAGALLAALLGASAGVAAKGDKAGCKDHPMFPSRMPGYVIEDCKTADYDAYDFWNSKAPRSPLRQEGRFIFITYALEAGKTQASALEVVRNYEAAFQKIGGMVMNIDTNRWLNGKVLADGKETWFQAERGNGKIWLRVIEKTAMQQHIVADAKAMSDDITATGHTAIYGIYFDTGKSEVKPESDAALAEIAKLLKAHPNLGVNVVGHTDNVGKLDYNMKLSAARAEAVAQVLAGKHGIAAGRMKGYGVASLAPVASNDSEEGRARNRRVELVKQ